MSLTGAVVSWGSVALCLAAFVACVLLWPRLAGRGPLPLGGRVGLLVGVNVLVLLVAAIQLNDQFLFFADWADLAGAISGTTTSAALHRGGTTGQAARVVVHGPAAQAPAHVVPPPDGRTLSPGVTSYRVTGPLSGITATVIVAVPDGYRADDPSTRYPVMETFAGYPGAPAQWTQAMHLPGAVDEQVAAHRLHPVVIVSPELEVPPGRDTECVDGPDGEPRIETWVTRDVPDWLVAHFQVRTDRGSWAAIGMSAGGWCAAMAAMLHPAQYGGAIVMAGYFRPVFGPAYDPFPPRGAQERRYDLVALARKHAPPSALWIGTSHSDPLSYATSSQVLAGAKPPLSISATVLQNAGHRTQVWLDRLPEALRWLGVSLPGFAP